MTQVNVLDVVRNEASPNPYNKDKPWQQGQEVGNTANADSMYFPDKTKPVVATAGPAVTTPTAQPNQGHDWEKRYKDLKPYHDETVATLRAELEALRAKVADKPSQDSNTSQTTAPVTDPIEQRLQTLEQREYAQAKKEAREMVLKAHPDMVEVVNTKEFSEWKKLQPKEVQDWVDKNPTNGSLAIRALDLYKADAAKAAQLQESNKSRQTSAEDASSLISTRNVQGAEDRTKKIWTAKEISSLSLDEYERLSAEIDQAQREGRVKR